MGGFSAGSLTRLFGRKACSWLHDRGVLAQPRRDLRGRGEMFLELADPAGRRLVRRRCGIVMQDVRHAGKERQRADEQHDTPERMTTVRVHG